MRSGLAECFWCEQTARFCQKIGSQPYASVEIFARRLLHKDFWVSGNLSMNLVFALAVIVRVVEVSCAASKAQKWISYI